MFGICVYEAVDNNSQPTIRISGQPAADNIFLSLSHKPLCLFSFHLLRRIPDDESKMAGRLGMDWHRTLLRSVFSNISVINKSIGDEGDEMTPKACYEKKGRGGNT